MSIEEQSNRNLAQFYMEELLLIHNEGVSYGKAITEKTMRGHLKSHGIVVRPLDKPPWYVELTPFTRRVLGVE